VSHVYQPAGKVSDTNIIAIVELDIKEMWVRIVWSREAIRERMRELEHRISPTPASAARTQWTDRGRE
jgi:hypothetical protein